jgi:hypothetical protein
MICRRNVRDLTKSRQPMGLEDAILKEVHEQGIERRVLLP